jgi:hypothetical protein
MNLLSSINNPIKSNLKPLYIDISYSVPDPSGNTFTNTDNSFKTNLLFQNTCTLTINNPSNNDLTIYYYIIGKGETGQTALLDVPSNTYRSGRGGRGGRIRSGIFICPSGNNLYNITINNAAYTGLNGGGIVNIINSNTNISNSASGFFSGGGAVTANDGVGVDGTDNTTIVFPDGIYYGGGGGSGGKSKSQGTIAGGAGGAYGGGNGGQAMGNTFINGTYVIDGYDGNPGLKYGGGGGGGGHAANGDNSLRNMGVGGVGGNGAVFIYFKERHKII